MKISLGRRRQLHNLWLNYRIILRVRMIRYNKVKVWLMDKLIISETFIKNLRCSMKKFKVNLHKIKLISIWDAHKMTWNKTSKKWIKFFKLNSSKLKIVNKLVDKLLCMKSFIILFWCNKLFLRILCSSKWPKKIKTLWFSNVNNSTRCPPQSKTKSPPMNSWKTLTSVNI